MPRDPNTLAYGSPAALPAALALRAGPVTLFFEAGDLRYLRWGNIELIRRWYVAVRDRNWGTVPARITDLELETHPDHFAIRYLATHQLDDIHFAWRAVIRGDRDGAISFSLSGQALSTFLRNRIGFCLLHPHRDCAGAPVKATLASGKIITGVFPRLIAASAPFEDLTALAHEAAPGVWAELTFTGDHFEMEDQRNWLDASFKTFCTPLRLPFPVPVPAGSLIEQSVCLRLRPTPVDAARAEEPSVSTTAADSLAMVSFGPGSGPAYRVPDLGVACASHGQALSSLELDRLRNLRLSHLRVDVDLAAADWQARLGRAAEESRNLDLSLEAVLLIPESASAARTALETVAAEVRSLSCRVVRWLVFSGPNRLTNGPLLTLARQVLGPWDAAARFGGGSDAYFTELNRFCTDPRDFDFLSYSVNPQVHAFDNRSIVETAETVAVTVRSARVRGAGLPIIISPVTLLPRFNPYATAPEPPAAHGCLPASVDPRIMSLFGAGWTLASFKYAAEAGVASLTYYETSGWLGLMERATGSRLPERFPSRPNEVFPVYLFFRELADFRLATAIPSRSSDPLRVEGLIVDAAGQRRWLLANLTGEPVSVKLQGAGPFAGGRLLSLGNVETAMLDPEGHRGRVTDPASFAAGADEVRLPPFALLALDETRG